MERNEIVERYLFESERRVRHSLPGEVVVLDLAVLVQGDREAVRFLGDHEAGGRIVLRNCPQTFDGG